MNLSCFENCYPTSQTIEHQTNDEMEKITKVAYVSFYTVVFYAKKWGIVQ